LYTTGPIFEYLKKYYTEKGAFEPEYLEGAVYKVVECEECGLIYQEYIPDNELLSRVYSVWLDPKAAAQRNIKALGSNAAQYVREQWLLRYWAKGKRLHVLDYGMGHGRWCETAAAFGHKVDGFEYEDARNENARRRELFDVVSYDDIARKQYDFINTEQVFEHLSDPLETIKHLVRGLKSGGMIRLSVPSGRLIKNSLSSEHGYNFSKRARAGLYPIVPLQHLNCFAGESLVKIATIVGLKQYRFSLVQMIASQQDWRTPKQTSVNILKPIYVRLRYDDGVMKYFVKP